MLKKIMLALCLILILPALADGTVRYQDHAEKFVFAPGSEYSETDLFDGFKGVMPGDTRTMTVSVGNDSDHEVRIFMKAEPAEPSEKGFLDQLHMTVNAASGDIFDAPAGEQAQLTDFKLLGTFKKNGRTKLYVTLRVPAELGNEYMDTAGRVCWTFRVEEIPDDPTPKTGDDLYTWLMAAGILAAGCAALAVIIRRKKRGAGA